MVDNYAALESQLARKISEIATVEDPAHDLLHFKRVVRTAKSLCLAEGGRLEIVIPSAWLHDFVIVPKNDPRRSQASRLSAEKAKEYLRTIPAVKEAWLDEIAHAIEAHSFSANISPRTLEAKIVQDADRLDGIGAIGVARCFATAGLLKRSFYAETDPFCETREPDDLTFTVDHFYRKLFKTAETLQTESGRKMGHERVQVMKDFLQHLAREI
jgi:uncharacterized protein